MASLLPHKICKKRLLFFTVWKIGAVSAQALSLGSYIQHIVTVTNSVP